LEQAAAVLGRGSASGPGFGGLDQLAAVAVTAAGDRSRRGADRVVVNPEAFGRLTATGRLVVLTHELTHVATRDVPVAPALWLQEGFADYVGYRDSGLTDAQVAADALPRVREAGPPTRLPDDAAFDPSRSDVAQAYAQAWAACALIARDGGLPTLVAFYRAAAAGPDPDRALDDALRTVLRQTRQQFEQRWSASLSALARQTPATPTQPPAR
jgi:hypothetical protein